MSPRGAITFVFDDGYESTYTNVLPLLHQYNFPGVFALPLKTEKLQTQENRQIRPYEKWQDIQKHGHELAAHSITHADLTKLEPKDLTHELTVPARTLPATTLIYPGGAHNDNVVEEAKKIYSAARTVRKGFESLPPQNPWQLKTYNFTRKNFSAAKANLLALLAFLTNSWLIETFHIVDNEEKEKTHAVSEDDFAAHLAFVQRLSIQVATIAQIIKPHKP
jgi:peptidoglycan/xylan/chitin deacetylase (PgdA/CDA1 family)